MAAVDKSIVFVLERSDCNGSNDGIEFYAFDDRLIPFKQKSKAKKNSVNKRKYIVVQDLKEIAQPFTKTEHCHMLAGYTSFGHQIFKVGGDHRNCNKRSKPWKPRNEPRPFDREAYCFDTRFGSWIRLPSMNVSRKDPHVHVLTNNNGKTITLFAIGGYGPSAKYESVKDIFPFMEQLQLRVADEGYVSKQRFVPLGFWIEKWLPVAVPKTVDITYYVSATIKKPITLSDRSHVGPGVLFGFNQDATFHMFHPSSNTWEHLSHLQLDRSLLRECMGWHSIPAMVFGRLLFWFNCPRNELVGLNIASGKYVCISLDKEGVLSSTKYLFPFEHLQPKLVALGDDDDEVVMAVMWIDHRIYGYQREGEVEVDEETVRHISGYICTKFTVDFDRALQGGGACIKILSTQKCLAPSNISGHEHHLSAVLTAHFCFDGAHGKLTGKTKIENREEEGKEVEVEMSSTGAI